MGPLAFNIDCFLCKDKVRLTYKHIDFNPNLSSLTSMFKQNGRWPPVPNLFISLPFNERLNFTPKISK